MIPGQRIRQRRLLAGMTQEELRELAKVKRATLAQYELGMIARPNPKALERINAVLDEQIAAAGGSDIELWQDVRAWFQLAPPNVRAWMLKQLRSKPDAPSAPRMKRRMGDLRIVPPDEPAPPDATTC